MTVTNPTGTSATAAADQFTYAAAPTVTSVSPTSGPTAGGTGHGHRDQLHSGATGVKFGSPLAGTAVIVTRQLITAHRPGQAAGHRRRDRHQPTGGTRTTGADDQFTYDAAPTVTNVSPSSGTDCGRDCRSR